LNPTKYQKLLAGTITSPVACIAPSQVLSAHCISDTTSISVSLGVPAVWMRPVSLTKEYPTKRIVLPVMQAWKNVPKPSFLEERDEDRDDGRTDRPEPHILLLMQKAAAGESSVKQQWFCAMFRFP
jgi:hypothetical protein